MESSERPCYKCYNCAHFQRYYTKKRIHFVMAKYGFCRKNNENVPIQNHCERFIFKNRNFTYDFMIQARLNDLLTEISALRDILQEEERERIESKSREKNCKTCAFCEEMYAKYAYRFDSLEKYFCNVIDAFTDSENICERYREKDDEPPDLSPARFDKAEENVVAMKRLLRKSNLATLRREKKPHSSRRLSPNDKSKERGK